MTLGHRRAKGGQEGGFEIVGRHVDVEAMPSGFRAAVHGEVFRRGDGPRMRRVRPLDALDEAYRHASGQVGVFAVGLLTASPARIAKDVHVRRPDGQPFVAWMIVTRTDGVEA